MKFFLLAAFSLTLPAQDLTRLTLAADLNGRSETTLYQNVPAVLSASIFLEQGEKTTIDLPESPWTAALSVSLINDRGDRVEWPCRPIETPAGPLNLQSLALARAFWVLSAEQTAGLAPGAYEARITFDTRARAAQHSWSGVVTSNLLLITVAPAPGSPSPGQSLANTRSTASYHALLEEWPAAVSALEAALEQTPGQITLLGDLAECLLGAGRLPEALSRINEALAQFDIQNPGSDEPASQLLNIRRRINARSAAAAREARQ